jgi:hypothetical protein
MRLASDEIEYIARKIVKTLVGDGSLQVDNQPQVIDGIIKAMTEELSIEDKLNEEVREVLSQHMAHMERSDIAYSDMFKKVKRELAKQKGIIL